MLMARSSTVSVAILDRRMHNAVVFNIKGPCWRLGEHQIPHHRHHRPPETRRR